MPESATAIAGTCAATGGSDATIGLGSISAGETIGTAGRGSGCRRTRNTTTLRLQPEGRSIFEVRRSAGIRLTAAEGDG
jgi:hypothetical protein